MKNCILFDLDGTLINENGYPKEFNEILYLINQLKNTYNFGVCTNRPYDKQVRKIGKDYKINDIFICESGALFFEKKLLFYKKYVTINVEINIKKEVEKIVNNCINNKNLKLHTKKSKKYIYMNKARQCSTTLYIPHGSEGIKPNLISTLQKKLQPYKIMALNDKFNSKKINIQFHDVNKLNTIKKYLNYDKIILITDYENFPIANIPENIKIYSVGTDTTFNRNATMVFSTYGKGVVEILKLLLKENFMKNYEVLSENCKLCWEEGFKHTNEKYTQVSGYIFNEKNQLLIVKNGKTWTVPGGHPELGETMEQTLEREIMEESCVTIKDVKYLGAVEVVENGETYYQMRYTARVKDILPFTQEWETCERMFVDLDNLQEYIKWCKGVTFAAQIESARKYWNF